MQQKEAGVSQSESDRGAWALSTRTMKTWCEDTWEIKLNFRQKVESPNTNGSTAWTVVPGQVGGIKVSWLWQKYPDTTSFELCKPGENHNMRRMENCIQQWMKIANHTKEINPYCPRPPPLPTCSTTYQWVLKGLLLFSCGPQLVAWSPWGNLVKSVIHVSRGHWKTKIPKCWKSYCFGYLVPVYTASDEKKTTGHLIAPFTNLLCLIQRIPMSPRDAYFLYHVFMLQVTCILHKSVVIDAIKIEFVYVRLSNGIVVFI